MSSDEQSSSSLDAIVGLGPWPPAMSSDEQSSSSLDAIVGLVSASRWRRG